jgi:hypothetical protein
MLCNVNETNTNKTIHIDEMGAVRLFLAMVESALRDAAYGDRASWQWLYTDCLVMAEMAGFTINRSDIINGIEKHKRKPKRVPCGQTRMLEF